MQAAHVHTTAYVRTHSVRFLSDNLLNTLRDVIRENGLNPEALMQERDTIALGMRSWLESGHLQKVVIEFYRPGATVADAVWEFPITYDGSGVDDDMWLDKTYLRQLIAKAKRPASDCRYRVLLTVGRGAPHVSGFSDCARLSTGSLTPRPAGSLIATGHLMAGVTYWR